jgi:uncharacterized protein YacL
MFKKFLSLFRKKTDGFLADISLLEDGRILNIVKSKFAQIKIYAAQFEIDEMQKSAASRNILKRNRAKRGLDIVAQLKSIPASFEIVKRDFPELKTADSKTLALAKELKIRILTMDFKLNRAALADGLQVLHLDAVSKTFRQVHLPGENIMIFLAREGSQNHQAVGYLDDGTMVVADEGRKFIGKRVELFITSVIQNSSGRMLFGKISDGVSEQEHFRKGAARQ